MNLVLLFFMFTFVGWVWECIFESIRNKKIINRGFLKGPCIPIYGFGGLLTYFIFTIRVSEYTLATNVTIFFVGMIGATILEYGTAVVLDKIFHTSWWDYTSFPLNYKGRICLMASLFWGLVVLVCSQVVNPMFFNRIVSLDSEFKLRITCILVFFFLLDLITTLRALINERNTEFEEKDIYLEK